MIHPTKGKGTIGYRFWVKTYYSPHHLGLDIHLPQSPLFAPTGGEIVKTGWNDQIGYYITFKDKFNKYHRFCHLSKRLRFWGSVKEGEQIGVTGNTGKMWNPATKHWMYYSPHLHWDCWNNYPNVALVKKTWDKSLLIDPEIYLKKYKETMKKHKDTIQFNSSNLWGRLSRDDVDWENHNNLKMVGQMWRFEDSNQVHIPVRNVPAMKKFGGKVKVVKRKVDIPECPNEEELKRKWWQELFDRIWNK